MLALAEYRAGCCRTCGGDLHETTDPAHEDGYARELPVRCHRCTALAASEDAYRDSRHPRALIHRVTLKSRKT